MNNKDEFFLKQMKGVNPINKKNRVEKEKLNLKNSTINKKVKIKKTETTTTKTKTNIYFLEFNEYFAKYG